MEDRIFKFIEGYFKLTEPEKETLSSFKLFRTYQKGELLVKAGELSHESYFILEGCVRCFYLVDGEERSTSFYTEGQSFEAVCEGGSQVSVQYLECLEDCILSVSNEAMEEQMFSKFPRFESLCRKLSEELVSSKQLAFDRFKNASPEERYLDLLQNRPDLLQRVPLGQIASYIGVKRESLSRIRKRVAQKNLP
ncbi:MAG: Crp/Fnr family transcriptional regulator [Bacteroidota bacterium]